MSDVNVGSGFSFSGGSPPRGKFTYDTDRLDFSTSTPLINIDPAKIKVLTTSSAVMKHYQKKMSKAVWRPAAGRKLGFLVVHDEHLLGLIFLASPVIQMSVRDAHLFPNKPEGFKQGIALREYMDMSICVAAQPIGWHWNLGKLMALIAPTLGDKVQARYSDDEFKGITTTSLWGRGTQYNRIYKFLGYTKGHGHEHISDEAYSNMVVYLRSRCPHCTPGCKDPLPLIPSKSGRPDCAVPSCRFDEGATNPRMMRIAAYRKALGEQGKNITLKHGHLRGVYYHAAISVNERQSVINNWYERWGKPRYERTRLQQPPYQNGLEDKPQIAA